MTKVLYNALDLKKGARTNRDKMGQLTQPIQMLPRKDKDEEWGAWNMDWLEDLGMKQVRRNAKRLLKNYKLAAGIIDRSDYIVENNNEMKDLVDILTQDARPDSGDETAMDLKFYPIIPNVINVLVGEFAKRNDKITYRSTDDNSYNEMLEEKRGMIEQTLVAQAEQKLIQQMLAEGMDPESEEAQQALSPENLKTLPEIESFFRKDYRSLYEEWATHQHAADEERFTMHELETTAFADMLKTDREFWHFNMLEDDYELELWNPVLSFYHKSPNVRYVAQGNHVGKFDLITVADAIDRYGYKMKRKQLESLEGMHPARAVNYALQGVQNDGSFYDSTKSHEWNTNLPSLGMRQFNSARDWNVMNDDIVSKILGESEDLQDESSRDLLRVTTAYWKSQRKLGHLSFIDEEGQITDTIVDESFDVTTRPMYDNTVLRGRSRENLLYGQHVEWMWINEVWGGIKIGPNRNVRYNDDSLAGFEPIYLDLKPVKFQFKGDFSLYGCKLPVEGAVFNDRNTRSTAFLDRLKPFQIGYNMVNNQISDILIDELGTIVMLDQRALPQYSQGEDWGKNNFQKAYVAMKDFSMLPVDTSIGNTESPMNFSHFQTLDLSQTQRLLSRVNLAQYFKQQAFETVGISMERLGAVNAQQTATAVEQAVNASYSQTETLFTQHSEYLMPRVHQMRTDLAQYYHSNKPSVRLSYSTTMDEKVNFQINGTELLGRDLNVFCSTKVNTRELIQNMKQLAMTNNTAGASIYDLGNLMKANSMAEVDNALKAVEQKVERQRQEEMQQEQQMQEQGLKAQAEAQAKIEAAEKYKLDGQWQNNIDVAEIKGAGFQTDGDDQQNYMDGLKQMSDDRHKEAGLEIQREKMLDDKIGKQQDRDLKRQDQQIKREISRNALQVARENKNKYDKPPVKKKS